MVSENLSSGSATEKSQWWRWRNWPKWVKTVVGVGGGIALLGAMFA